MLEIIDQVLKAEREAEAMVSQAKESASKATSKFEQEERERLQNARSEADQESRDRLAAVRSELQQQYEDAVADAQERADRYVRDNQEAVGRAVSNVVRLLSQTEVSRSSQSQPGTE